MSTMLRERRDSMLPALVAAALLHAGIAALFLVYAPEATHELIVSSVPVTIVSDAPATAPQDIPDVPSEPPAEVAVEAAPPPPPPPVAAPPEPKPAPQVKPTPTPKPTPVKPPARPKPTPAVSDNWLDSVADGPATPRKPTRTTAAPPKPESHPGGAPNRGPVSLTGKASLALISRQVSRKWSPNCNASNLDDINPVIRFQLDSTGRLVGDPTYMSGDPAAAHANGSMAIAAMRQAAPFDDVTDDLVGRTLELTFRASKVCAGR